MKLFYSFLGLVSLALAIRLLSSDGGLGEYLELQKQLTEIQAENQAFEKTNQLLQQEVQNLQSSTDAIETIARQKLGMIKENEVFVQVIELPKLTHSIILAPVEENYMDNAASKAALLSEESPPPMQVE